MTPETHLAVGWVLAHLGGRQESRRFRAIVVAAALLPDIDAVSYVFGRNAFANCHHAVGHNVFFSILMSVACIFFLRRQWAKVLLFTQIAFYTHYFGDYFLTRFELVYFWPVSDRYFIFSYAVGLDHWINITLTYLAFVVMVPMALLYKRTPLEFVSLELDKRVVNLLFRRKDLTCHVCGRKANERCVTCGEPLCMRHARMTRRFIVECAADHATVVAGAERHHENHG